MARGRLLTTNGLSVAAKRINSAVVSWRGFWVPRGRRGPVGASHSSGLGSELEEHRVPGGDQALLPAPSAHIRACQTTATFWLQAAAWQRGREAVEQCPSLPPPLAWGSALASSRQQLVEIWVPPHSL